MVQPIALHPLPGAALDDFLAGFLLAAVGVSLWARLLHRRRRLRLTAEAVATERRRIARELHDAVGHGLIVIAMNARRLPAISAQTQPVAQAIDDAVQTTVADVRRLIKGLREEDGTPPGDEPGEPLLSTSLKRLCARFEDRDITLSLLNTRAERLVAPEVRRAIFRIAQECVTNSLKHGYRPVRILLKFDRDLTLCVADGPFGNDLEPLIRLPLFRAGDTRTGYGLLGLRERVSELGGSIVYGSSAHGGFVVRARIPMAPATNIEGNPRERHPRPGRGRSATR
jgi:signal transduction histidine kinase